jgi:cyclase
MYRPRIIPLLLLHNNGLVITKKFSNPHYIGDPVNILKIFNEKFADEIFIADISCRQ